MAVLNDYARFVREKHLEDFVEEELKLVFGFDIPIMKLIANMPREQLKASSTKSATELLESIENGQFLAVVKRNLKNWEEDKLEGGIRKNQIHPTDLVQIYAAQKMSLLKFLPGFTKDVNVATNIVENVLSSYAGAQELAYGLLFRIRQEEEEKLKKSEDELKKSNEELEQFAYIASHDLQEPLRMVTNYTQLLERKYSENIDAEGAQFIGFIVEGAKRMRTLINDLLEYSRLNRGTKKPVKIDLNKLMEEVKNNLEKSIEEKRAEIKYDHLPVLKGDKSQLLQLFQNLVGNALKFNKGKPVVEIHANGENNLSEITVKDNGIGISEEYSDRIFGMFQRLNPREEYPGSGIGLAICKRIVEKHGGSIWFDSEPGKGTTFHFTLKK